MTLYDPGMPMLEARAAYFAANDFGQDGGYDDDVVWFALGPLKFPVPNTAGRKVAVRYHDLHHIVTGYDTDWRGEFEIAAYEIGAGCERLLAAWVINLGGLMAGLVLMPSRTTRAFYRGRHSHSLYKEDLQRLLGARVHEVRTVAGCETASEQPGPGDRRALLGWLAVALAMHLVPLALVATGIAIML